ncbi:hypothetical protein [Mycolicibacterium aichiense]|nr:hypothetical protein [Mycolicibacterium aichiense]MCV7019295.1 hypothetical protein [Mycolicibacterium aichiense]
MTEPIPPEPDRPDQPATPPPEHRGEDVAFPEWFRTFWRNLLGPKNPS